MTQPTGSATTEPHGNVALIVQFLRTKGLSDPVIAGILGNMSVEDSSFDPTVPNPGEGAIGLCQWEGGRRTALQQWASAHGGSETDLNMQLGFMWHELQTSKSGVLSQIQGMSDARQVAAIWDAQFEVSSGAARQQRENNAAAFLGNNLRPIAGDSSNAGGGAPSGPGAGGGNGGHGGYKNVDALGKLLDQVPELRALVNQAQAGDWTTTRFENAIESSDWWRSHSSTARSILATQANDPATYQSELRSAEQLINGQSRQLGMTLTAQQIEAIATSSLLSGNQSNQEWITRQISRREDYSNITDLGGLQGGMAATSQQLQQIASDYGLRWSPSEIAQRAQNVLSGGTTLDTFKQRAMSWAQSAFPGLSDAIAGGSTVKDLADPYFQSMSQLLEVDPGTLNLYTPLIRQALQGTRPAGAKPGDGLTPLSLYDFEKQVRQDPRWQYTSNAKDTMSSALLHIGSVFGFGPEG